MPQTAPSRPLLAPAVSALTASIRAVPTGPAGPGKLAPKGTEVVIAGKLTRTTLTPRRGRDDLLPAVQIAFDRNSRDPIKPQNRAGQDVPEHLVINPGKARVRRAGVTGMCPEKLGP